VQGRRHATWFEQHFPDDELSEFAVKVGEGLVFATCSVRTWLMVLITCLATLLCSPGATEKGGTRGNGVGRVMMYERCEGQGQGDREM
jgi:hypothetical protein